MTEEQIQQYKRLADEFYSASEALQSLMHILMTLEKLDKIEREVLVRALVAYLGLDL